ncbi:hypothetical protein Glove_566g71 [Diversispora epigaea]|uniref:Uncharacterized protein n=1 Tax=Diversispora epigaea TaxID=1348612 RepID=A0A397GCN4_9GLOM|nr:hypothetical protein Glove_566g71 [Diversispora epigaea]
MAIDLFDGEEVYDEKYEVIDCQIHRNFPTYESYKKCDKLTISKFGACIMHVAEEETETIPKFPNNTYSDLMTLIIQHNLNNKAGNAIIHFFNKHSNLSTSPLPKNIEQERKLMDRMKLINLLNKEKIILKYNNKDYIIYYQPIINSKDDTQKKSEEHKNIVHRTFHKSFKFLLSPLYNENNSIKLELNNRILWYIPRISMIISDWPEAYTFSLTYKSTQSNHSCHFCLVSKENLSNINLNSNQIEPRSHKNMKLHYKNNMEKNVSIEKGYQHIRYHSIR